MNIIFIGNVPLILKCHCIGRRIANSSLGMKELGFFRRKILRILLRGWDFWLMVAGLAIITLGCPINLLQRAPKYFRSVIRSSNLKRKAREYALKFVVGYKIQKRSSLKSR